MTWRALCADHLSLRGDGLRRPMALRWLDGLWPTQQHATHASLSSSLFIWVWVLSICAGYVGQKGTMADLAGATCCSAVPQCKPQWVTGALQERCSERGGAFCCFVRFGASVSLISKCGVLGLCVGDITFVCPAAGICMHGRMLQHLALQHCFTSHGLA